MNLEEIQDFEKAVKVGNEYYIRKLYNEKKHTWLWARLKIIKEISVLQTIIKSASRLKINYRRLAILNNTSRNNMIEEQPTNLSNNDNDEIKIKLKHILETSKCNHKIEIMKQPNIKRAHIYCKIHQLSGQVSGPLIEHYIKNKYGMIKNNSSLCNGDLQHNQTNFEIKVSNGGKENNKFNYVQLRMNHSCEYILTAYHINYDNIETEGELFIFKLTKINIKIIILKYGVYAHGTKRKLGEITEDDLENPLNNKEYAIRPKYGDKCWNELLQFRVHEI